MSPSPSLRRNGSSINGDFQRVLGYSSYGVRRREAVSSGTASGMVPGGDTWATATWRIMKPGYLGARRSLRITAYGSGEGKIGSGLGPERLSSQDNVLMYSRIISGSVVRSSAIPYVTKYQSAP